MAILDDNGQPLNRLLNRDRRVSRAIDELIGFLRGIAADNVVSAGEVLALGEWTLKNREAADVWPVNVLVARLNRIVADGVIDDEEREDLRMLVAEILGEQARQPFTSASTELPLTRPAPDVIFDQNEFVLTGSFLYGPRRVCEKEILVRGGTCADAVRLRTSYLVIGSLASEDWIHTTHGRKIEKAVDYSKRYPLAIISEQHWESFLLPAPTG